MTIHQVAKPVYRALQLLNKLANGRVYRSDAQPQVDNVDVWGTRDISTQSDAKHAVFITNFNVSCDATPLPGVVYNLTLRTPPACSPSAATVYTIDDVNGAKDLQLSYPSCSCLVCSRFGRSKSARCVEGHGIPDVRRTFCCLFLILFNFKSGIPPPQKFLK